MGFCEFKAYDIYADSISFAESARVLHGIIPAFPSENLLDLLQLNRCCHFRLRCFGAGDWLLGLVGPLVSKLRFESGPYC